jgi:hypothetical protein
MAQPRFSPDEKRKYQERVDKDDTGMGDNDSWARSHAGVHVHPILMRVLAMASVAVCVLFVVGHL